MASITPELLSVAAISRFSSRRSSFSSTMGEERTSGIDAIRHDIEDVKDMIRRLYKQIDSYDAKRVDLLQDFENLKRANKDYELKVKDLNDIFRNPPQIHVYSETSSPSTKYVSRLDTHSYSSTRSSRSSSPPPTSYREKRNGVFHDDYDDDDDDDDLSYEDNYDDRTFTKSIDNFEIEDTSDA